MQEANPTSDAQSKAETATSQQQLEGGQALPTPDTAISLQQPKQSPVPQLPAAQCVCLTKFLGPILICWAALCKTTNQYLFKLIAAKYSATAFELIIIRGLLSMTVALVGMTYNRLSPFALSANDGLLVCAYSIGYVLETVLQYLGVLGLNVSLASVVFCTLPIIVAILARLVLGEPFAVIGIVCTFISVIGLGMAMKQPAAIFGGNSNEDSTIGLYVGFILLAGVCCACTGMVSRKIGGRVSFFITTFYVGIVMALVNALILYFGSIPTSFGVGKFFTIMSLHCIPYVGQIGYYLAHKYVMAATCSYYVFVQAILAFFGDIIILRVSTDYIQIVGALIVILCGVAITTQKVLTPTVPQR